MRSAAARAVAGPTGAAAVAGAAAEAGAAAVVGAAAAANAAFLFAAAAAAAAAAGCVTETGASCTGLSSGRAARADTCCSLGKSSQGDAADERAVAGRSRSRSGERFVPAISGMNGETPCAAIGGGSGYGCELLAAHS